MNTVKEQLLDRLKINWLAWRHVEAGNLFRLVRVSFGNTLKYLGGLLAVYQLIKGYSEFSGATYLINNGVIVFFIDYFFLIALLLFFIFIIRNSPKTFVERKIEDTKISVVIAVDDIFRQVEGEDIIIGVDRAFNTDLSLGRIDRRTLHGQLLGRFFPNYEKRNSLDRQIIKKLDILNIEVEKEFDTINGKTKVYPLGTTLGVEVSKHRYFYLAGFINLYDSSEAINLEEYHNNIWKSIQKDMRINQKIAISVTGSLKRNKPASFTREDAIFEMVKSFIEYSSREKFCDKLKICIYWKDLEYYNFNRISEDLDYLCTYYYKDLLKKDFVV